MKKALILSVMGGFIISLALVSCKKDEKISDPTPVQPPVNVLTTSLSGLGFHGGQPSGASFILPSNIKIIGDITGGYYGGKSFVGDKNKENFKTYLTSLESSKLDFTQYGYGTYVNLYMELKNTSNFSYDFEIPATRISRWADGRTRSCTFSEHERGGEAEIHGRRPAHDGLQRTAARPACAGRRISSAGRHDAD